MVLPCLGRPLRTRRMIDCIFNQTINNWELFIVGDNCSEFKKLSDSLWFQQFVERSHKKGNSVQSWNSVDRSGGYGYYVINDAIKYATGKYFIFGGNDDMIKPNHFSHYLSGIENTDLDFAYYNTWVHPHNMIRMAQPVFGSIGHAELIVRTDFAKTIKPHSPAYGHDWEFIEEMMRKTNKYKRIEGEGTTYQIMSVPGKTLDIID